MSMEDFRKVVIDVGADDWCMDGKKRRSASASHAHMGKQRCERGLWALRRLPPDERGACSRGSNAKCRYVPENTRYECTILSQPQSKASPCFGFGLFWGRARDKLIKFSDCIQLVLAAIPATDEEAMANELKKYYKIDSQIIKQKQLNIRHFYSLTSQYPRSKISSVDSKADFFDKIKEHSGKLIVLVVYAKLSDIWIALSKELEDLVDLYSGTVVFFKYDMDVKLEAVHLYDDAKLPTFYLVSGHDPNGKLKETVFHTTSSKGLAIVLERHGAIPRTREEPVKKFISSPRIPMKFE